MADRGQASGCQGAEGSRGGSSRAGLGAGECSGVSSGQARSFTRQRRAHRPQGKVPSRRAQGKGEPEIGRKCQNTCEEGKRLPKKGEGVEMREWRGLERGVGEEPQLDEP